MTVIKRVVRGGTVTHYRRHGTACPGMRMKNTARPRGKLGRWCARLIARNCFPDFLPADVDALNRYRFGN